MSGSKILAIMQPYFLPYLGYWQLMAMVDEFVIYDDIQFTKKGWIHRNRFLSGGKDQMFTLPLKKDSDYLDVFERRLADSWHVERDKLYRRLTVAYQKAPFYNETAPLLEKCIYHDSVNLFEYIFNSIVEIGKALEIKTKILISSELGNTKNMKGVDRVVSICQLRNAKTYINPIGGRELYRHEHFRKQKIDLNFHQIDDIKYKQFGNEFIPCLSIVDVLMFNGIEKTQQLLTCCEVNE